MVAALRLPWVRDFTVFPGSSRKAHARQPKPTMRLNRLLNCAGTTVLDGAKHLECACFSTAFPLPVTDHRHRKAAVNRPHSTRFATPPPDDS
jgi:hypothetical protein